MEKYNETESCIFRIIYTIGKLLVRLIKEREIKHSMKNGRAEKYGKISHIGFVHA